MREILLVRTEYYNSGLILPTGITYDNREVENIKEILSYERINAGTDQEKRKFRCVTNHGELCLSLENARWTIDPKASP